MRHRNVQFTSMLFLLITALFISDCSHGSASREPNEDQIVLPVAPDKYIEVPLSGPQYDENAATVAKEINKVGAELTAWQESGAVTNAEVRKAMFEIASQMQWEAAANIDLAYRVAKKTSGGPLDPSLIERASKLNADASALTKIQPPDTVYVSTEISTSVDGAALHYMSLGDYYQNKDSGWRSYSDGQTMRIGRYMFRVQPPSPVQGIYREILLVISDPTKRKIVPVVGGDK
jgi:hypothetical protein